MKKLLFLLGILFVGFSACKSDSDGLSLSLVLNEAIPIKVTQSLKNDQLGISILMDSVLNDSRCPSGGTCIWAGNAEVRFVFKINNTSTTFKLNTFLLPKDTTINGYTIKLLGLNPYPSTSTPISYDKYYATILVQKN